MNRIPRSTTSAATIPIVRLGIATISLLVVLISSSAGLSQSPSSTADAAIKTYWLDDYGIKRANIDGSNPETVLSRAPAPVGIAYDPVTEMVYWSEGYPEPNPTVRPNKGIIRRARTGSNVFEEVMETGVAVSLTIDPVARKLYWIDGLDERSIRRSNLDGSEVEILVDTGLSHPASLVLGPDRKIAYWSDYTLGVIEQLDLLSSEVRTVVQDTQVASVAVDPISNHLYWTSTKWAAAGIKRSNLDGSDIVTVLSMNNPSDSDCSQIPLSIAIHPGRGELYWTSDWWPNGLICRSSLDGEGIELFGTGGYMTLFNERLPTTDLFELEIVDEDDLAIWGSQSNWKGWPTTIRLHIVSVIESLPHKPFPIPHWKPWKPTAFVFDPDAQTTYWADGICHYYYCGQGLVRFRELDGTVERLFAVNADYGNTVSDLAFFDDTLYAAGGSDWNTPEPLGDVGRHHLNGYSIAIDTLGRRAYLLQRRYSPDEFLIIRSDLNGNGEEVLHVFRELFDWADRPKNIAVDWASGRLYWRQGASIRSMAVDGSDIRDLIAEAGSLTSFALDGVGRKLYWSVGSDFKRANLDGSGIETVAHAIHAGQIVNPYGVLASSMPSLVVPESGSVHEAGGIMLRWNPVDLAERYSVQVATDTGFASIVFRTNVPAAHVEFGSPVAGTTYYWRVQGERAGVRSKWSDAWSFRVRYSPPVAVALELPPNGSSNVGRRPAFQWRREPTAFMYQIQVADDESMTHVVANDSAIMALSTTPGVLLDNNRTYFWRARARNAGGDGPWSEVWSFRTVTAAPHAVDLISPADGAAGVSLTPAFSWSPLESALMYQLQVAADSQLSVIIVNDSALTRAGDTLDVLLGNDTWHYWRVRARNAGGDGPWSEVWSFRTEVATPTAVSLGAPEDGATGIPPFAALSWLPLDDVSGYHLQLASDSNFTVPVIDDSLIAETSSVLTDPLPYSTTFYWHVRAGRDDGLGKTAGIVYGPWSKTRSFTVATGVATEADATLPAEFALHPPYPNPFNPSTTIGIDLPEAAMVQLTVFDALGRVVESLVNGQRAAGRHHVTWEPEGVPSGVYFVRMEAGDFSSSHQIRLVK